MSSELASSVQPVTGMKGVAFLLQKWEWGGAAVVGSYFRSNDRRVWILFTTYTSSFPERWNTQKGLKHRRTIGVVW